MQLIPIMANPPVPSLENQEAIDAELFWSLLEAAGVDGTALPNLGDESKDSTMPIPVLDLEEDDPEPLELAAALLSLVATPVPLESIPEQEFEAVSSEELSASLGSQNGEIPKTALFESRVVSLLEELEAPPVELLEELRQKLESNLAVVTSEQPQELQTLQAFKSHLTAGTSLPQVEQKQLEQVVLASLKPLFGPGEPPVKPLFFALFPTQQVEGESVEASQEVVVQPLVFPVSPEAETQMELTSYLPQSLAQVVEPEKPPAGEQAGDFPEPGFILTQSSRETVADKLEAPPVPREPFSFEEIMSRATVQVGKQIQQLAVKIQPQSLGKVLLRVAVEEGQLVAKFLTESNQAKGILELNLPQLRENLAKEGLVLERCQVALGWGEEFGQQQRQEPRSRYRPRRRAVNYEEHLGQSESGAQVGLVNFLV